MSAVPGVSGVPGATGVPGVSGVPGVPGGSGVTWVPGVPEVSGVSGVPGIDWGAWSIWHVWGAWGTWGDWGAWSAWRVWGASIWAAVGRPRATGAQRTFQPKYRGQGCSGCSRGCLCQIQVSCSRQVGWKEECRAEGTFLAAMGQEGEGDGQQRWPGLGPHPIQLPAPSSPSLVQTHRNADHGMTTAGTHGGDWSCQDPELKAGLGVGEG